ncbi:T9SS type A sorting domain-containing protein [Adhaeribacter swui]|uniref:T9SS type A sorting domain-containing protein n=1 Tax=Adhaeribacter swui TaxID=2086471 RepID=A0A7G7GET4_9BACT|nr:T9SS type A sorting domain-containing protein [Adhaeribacter swui]QNF35668.1 T9SS type A sorting domain-containing protein [Adhaeribacter swui]
MWDKRYGGSRDDHLYSISNLPNNEYLIAGFSSSGKDGDKSQASQGGKDFWMVKVNSSGTKLWDKRLGGSGDEELRTVVRNSDGSLLLAGKSSSNASGDKSQSSQGNSDFWVVKTSSDGTKQWDRRFGGSGAEELRNVLVTADSDYLLCGRSESGISGDKTQNSYGNSDYWLIKMDAIMPNANSVAQNTGAAMPAAPVNKLGQIENAVVGLTAYPNPFADQLTVSFVPEQSGPVQVQLYNGLGRQVATLYQGEAVAGKHYTYTWQPSGQMSSGMYIVRVTTAGKSYQQKVILQQ